VIDEILVSAGPAETRVALIGGGRLRQLDVLRPDEAACLGRVYLGRAGGGAPGMAARFVDIGLAQHGLLAARDAGGRLPDEGAQVLVQASGEPAAGKGAPLRTEVELAGRALVFRPRGRGADLSRRLAEPAERERLAALGAKLAEGGGGFVLRTAATGRAEAALAAEAARLRRRWQEIVRAAATARPPALLHADEPLSALLREHLDAGVKLVLFDHRETLARARAWAEAWAPEATDRLRLHDGADALSERHEVEAELEAVLRPRVPLAGGGWLNLEGMAALTAIDVNAGARVGADAPEPTALAVNLEAAAEIARQLRLRAIGGLVVIDFLRMAEAGAVARVLAALRAALEPDPTPTRIGGMSAFGLVELSRRRDRPALAERLSEPWTGNARRPSARHLAESLLRRAEREARRGRAGALALLAAPDVIRALATLPGLGDEAALAERLGCRVTLRPQPGRPREAFEVAAEPASG
jgi:ribonuclease G